LPTSEQQLTARVRGAPAWLGIAASSAVLVLGAASTPELWVQVRLSYGSDLWVYPTIYHSTEDFCPFLFLFKGPDRIQGYMDTPDTIWIILCNTAECTVSDNPDRRWWWIGSIAILSGCELYAVRGGKMSSGRRRRPKSAGQGVRPGFLTFSRSGFFRVGTYSTVQRCIAK
jgi:hypothetical protein